MCTIILPPDGNPNAVNKYIIFICPHGKTRLPLDFYKIWYLIISLKSVAKTNKNLTRITGTLYKNLRTFIIMPCWILPTLRNFSTHAIEKIKTQILFSVPFSETHTVYEIILKKIWYSQTGHIRQYNTAHALCMLDKWGYRHLLKICNY
jgi:hypothetical protein